MFSFRSSTVPINAGAAFVRSVHPHHYDPLRVTQHRKVGVVSDEYQLPLGLELAYGSDQTT